MREKSWEVKNASVLEEERVAQGKLQGRQQGCKGKWVVNGGAQTGEEGLPSGGSCVKDDAVSPQNEPSWLDKNEEGLTLAIL